jgi:serine/threonine protein phosphatase PrpC
MSIAVVTDGHGSDDCFRSARGAKFATDCAIDGLFRFCRELKKTEKIPSKAEGETLLRSDKNMRGLIYDIVTAWHRSVDADCKASFFTDEELAGVSEKYRQRYIAGEAQYHAYGTTLIAAVVTPDYWFGFHIGDGRFTVLNADGTFSQPVPWDDRCFLNVTTSICDDDAVEKARIYYAPRTELELPAAIFLCSDGVDDNYPVDENEKHLYALYKTIAQTFADEGFDATIPQLEDLANSFATKGKGDDTSIAGIIDIGAVKAALSVEILKEIVENNGDFHGMEQDAN